MCVPPYTIFKMCAVKILNFHGPKKIVANANLITLV